MDLEALSAPLPRERRDRRLLLDGTWELELGGETLAIEVPFTFEAPLSGIGRGGEVHERVRYRRAFRVPSEWHGLHVLLRFGGVDWHASVAVDGQHVGTHTGGYTHFSFDLGELDHAAEHEIIVDVHDPADGPQPRGKQRGSGGIWYTRATGIWRSVWLEAVPQAHITAFKLEVTPDGVVQHEVETSEPHRGDRARRARRRRSPRWSPESPQLVDVELRTASGDLVRSYVAFRTVERSGRDILLNGERRFLCGVLDQAYWPDGVYTAPSFDALRADVQAVKDLGFDLARMHVKVADPRWYALCDALGVLVAQDLPSPLRLDTEEARAGFTREAEEIVAQLRGHPCVCMWIAINEDWGEPGAEYQLASRAPASRARSVAARDRRVGMDAARRDRPRGRARLRRRSLRARVGRVAALGRRVRRHLARRRGRRGLRLQARRQRRRARRRRWRASSAASATSRASCGRSSRMWRAS